MLERIKNFLHRPYVFLMAVGALSLALTGSIELLQLSCKLAKTTAAGICVTTDKVKIIADTVAMTRDDSLRLDLGEALSDQIIERHKDGLILDEITPAPIQAKLRARMVQDSTAMVRLHRILKIRRKD